MNGTTVEYVSRHAEYTYDLVGNRSTMTVIEDDNAGFVTRTLVTYDYDANDRLTRAVSDTDPISLSARDRFDRYYASRPSGWTRPAVLAFWGLCLTAFWAPLIPWRRLLRARSASAGTLLNAVGASPGTEPSGSSKLPLGRRARRKRLFTACVATFLVPLMAVQPDAVQALNTEALRAQTALTAGVLLDTDPTVTETIFTYDANGNQIGRQTTQDGSTTTETYIFDAENRLVGYRKARDGVPDLSSSASYTYDADGIRASKTVGNATILYLTDKQQPYAQVLEERDASTGDLLVRYTYGDDLISQTRPDSSDPINNPPITRYFHYDGQMSTRQLTDAAAPASVSVTDHYAYDAFGVAIQQEGSTENAYRYTGEQLDASVGLIYLRARYYPASIGRFGSRDSFGGLLSDPASLHRYAYVASNPVNACDPSGLMTLIELSAGLAIMALISAIVLTAVSVVLNIRQEAGLLQIVREALFVFGVTVLSIMSTPFLIAALIASAVALGVQILGGDFTRQDAFKLGIFMAVAILLMVFFRVSGLVKPPSPSAATPEALPPSEPISPTAGAPAPAASGPGFTLQPLEGGIVEITGQTAKGPVSIWAAMSIEGDALWLRGLAIEGPGPNSLGLRALIEMARQLGKEQGVQEVIIEGGKRSTGAFPGKVPRQIRVGVNE